MSRVRLVYYDDTDIAKGVSYSEGWFESFDRFSSDRGLVWQGTQHGTFANRASMEFSFVGDFVSLAGRVNTFNFTSTHMISANWTCSVDGELVENAMASLPTSTPQMNNFGLCSQSGLSNGRHLLSVEVEASEELPFWVDRISVRPVIAQLPPNSTVQVNPLDEDFLYVSGKWDGPEGGDYRFTTQAGASVILDFHGTKVIWVSETVRDQPAGTSTGLYTLDDGEPVPFTILGLARGEFNSGNRILFETDTFPAGKHRLNVTYMGFSAPLVLDRLVIEGGDVVPLGGTSPDSPFGKATVTTKPNVGAIAGGIVGGVAALLIILVSGWILYRKKLRRQQELTPVINIGVDYPASRYEPSPHMASTYPQHAPTLQPLRYGTPLNLPNLPSNSSSAYGSSLYPGSLDQNASLHPSHPRPVRASWNPFSGAEGTSHSHPSESSGASDTRSLQPQPSITQGNPVSEKTRLAQKYAAMDQAPGLSSTVGSSSHVQLLQHNDSGIRLPNSGEGPGVAVEELPPSYTPA
ncbi:hypothetical protein FA15DRAFT_203912 [Coprinopsis marcescibilis]|uniref:Transmembrane protein n=1 Tax=Coprinopsis marcescibilis TaxID=230819 RepID=A0A5C3LNC3_COPMA|nr:hypothetical protein FA15DRAFT_203912 [Coprinopsis marcescibilis]